MARWLVVLHALDRTGPPMLARDLLRWMRRHRPEDELEVVALRGGPLAADVVALAPLHVLLDPHEAWDLDHPRPGRVQALAAQLAPIGPADAVLLVSAAAGQVLPLLPASTGPVVTWVVEQREGLHWLDRATGLRLRTARWLAGSDASVADLGPLLGGDEVHLVPEFIDLPARPDDDLRARCRAALAGGDVDHLVVGSGIASWRKAPDLFVEVAVASGRRHPSPGRFAWIGGEHDPLYPDVAADVGGVARREVRLFDSMPDLGPWLAAADVFLHPAREDSFPLVCLQAAAAGTPVVGFTGTGVGEMFGDAFRGVEFPDVGALADLVHDLRDPGSRLEVAAAQGRRVAERYAADTCAPLLVEHLTAAAGEQRP